LLLAFYVFLFFWHCGNKYTCIGNIGNFVHDQVTDRLRRTVSSVYAGISVGVSVAQNTTKQHNASTYLVNHSWALLQKCRQSMARLGVRTIAGQQQLRDSWDEC